MRIFTTCAALLLTAVSVSAEKATFRNPIAEGADPWVTRHGDQYLWCFSTGNRGISVWISDRLTSIGTRHEVWSAPETGPFSKQVWAPEMHFLDGKWYIYFAASDGKNENHLAYVLESKDADPLGPYQIQGPLLTGDGADGKSPNIWAIDMTVLDHRGTRYAIWSGWDTPTSDRQFLYIAPLKNPHELAAPRVRLCANDTYPWEMTDESESSRGLNEGPEILKHADRTFLTYSCSASWRPSYKLGLLELTGQNPLDPAAWKKHPLPVFSSAGSVIGVGHSTFVPSPDGSEIWHVYHAKTDASDGWQRAISIQPIAFKNDGFPDLGSPLKADAPLPVPAGQRATELKLPLAFPLQTAADLRGFSYYGHQQFLAIEKDGVDLGKAPDHPNNPYRSGEKLVLNDSHFTDIQASVTLRFVAGGRDAGLLFRTSLPAVGYDAQQGYFAGIIPSENRVILGKTDGKSWQEIARADLALPAAKDIALGVRAIGTDLQIFVNGKQILKATDSTYTNGSIGLRVIDTHVRFTNLKVDAAR